MYCRRKSEVSRHLEGGKGSDGQDVPEVGASIPAIERVSTVFDDVDREVPTLRPIRRRLPSVLEMVDILITVQWASSCQAL